LQDFHAFFANPNGAHRRIGKLLRSDRNPRPITQTGERSECPLDILRVERRAPIWTRRIGDGCREDLSKVIMPAGFWFCRSSSQMGWDIHGDTVLFLARK